MLRDKSNYYWTNKTSGRPNCIAYSHDDRGETWSYIEHVHSVCRVC